MRERHNVYVIELDKDVLYESKFKKANTDYTTGKLCVYVGMTGHDPYTRFDQHKAGIKSNKYAMKYGIRLMPYETSRKRARTITRALFQSLSIISVLRLFYVPTTASLPL